MLGSWALFVLGLGLASIAVAGEWINVKDSQKLQRYVAIEKLLGERVAGRSVELRQARKRSESSLNLVRSKMTTASRMIDQTQRRSRIIAAPINRTQEEKTGVPPDAYYVELARKNGMNVVRLNPGESIDADTGRAAKQTGGGVWDWIGQSVGSHRVLTVVNNSVVEVSNGKKRELPSGELIHAGETIVIPPVGTPQRLEKESEELAQSDPPPKVRFTQLREKGESIFGGH